MWRYWHLSSYGKYEYVVLCLDNAFYKKGYKIFLKYLDDYKSMPNFMCSLAIFSFFTKLDLGKNTVINYFASITLDVYIIHQTKCFYMVLWFDICKTDYWTNSRYILFYFVCITLHLFFSCCFIDKIRARLI